MSMEIGQYLDILVLEYQFDIPIFRFFFLILVPYNHIKLNNSPQLRLGGSKMSLDIGEYLHIHVLKYLSDILIFRYILEFSCF